jgi:hypothetical protein
MKTEALINSVQKVVSSYLDANPDLSLGELSDKAMSSQTTLRGLKNNSIKFLSVKKALEISGRLGGPKSLEDLMSLSSDPYEQKEASAYSKNFSHLFDYELMPTTFDSFLADKEYARIVWAAFGASHITRKEIEYRFGQDGITKLNELLAFGLVIEEYGIIKGNTETAGFSLDSTYKQLGLGYECYNPSNRTNQENWVSFQTESVNPKFIKEFRQKMQELFQQFQTLSSSDEFHGDQRVFFGMIYDRYMPDLSESKELQ